MLFNLDECPNCRHDDPHDSGGIGACSECGCDDTTLRHDQFCPEVSPQVATDLPAICLCSIIRLVRDDERTCLYYETLYLQDQSWHEGYEQGYDDGIIYLSYSRRTSEWDALIKAVEGL